MNRQTVKVLVAAALGGFVLAAAGCGGGSSTTTTTETTTTSATTTGAAGTTTTAAGAVGAVGGLLSSKNCRNLVNLSASFSQAITGAVSGADLQKAETLMKQFADKTPADIR